MKQYISLAIIISFLAYTKTYSQAAFTSSRKNSSIYVELRAGLKSISDSVSLSITTIPTDSTPLLRTLSEKKKGNNALWTIRTAKAISASLGGVKASNGLEYLLLEPGDSIIVYYKNGELSFEGIGSEKLNLLNSLASLIMSTSKLKNQTEWATTSKDDYISYHLFLKNQRNSIENIMRSYKNSISNFAYEYIEDRMIDRSNVQKMHKFFALSSLLSKQTDDSAHFKINSQLCDIYDSTLLNDHREILKQTFLSAARLDIARLAIRRKYNFSASFSEKEHLEEILDEFKNLQSVWLKDYFLYQALDILIFKLYNINQHTDSLIDKYSSKIVLQDYKELFNRNLRKEGDLYPPHHIPYFSVSDRSGTVYNIHNFRGKLILLNFWNKDNYQVRKMRTALLNIQKKLGHGNNFLVLNIFSDTNKAKWISQTNKLEPIKNQPDFIIQNKFVLRAYGIYQLPAIYLVDQESRLIIKHAPDPIGNQAGFIRLLKPLLKNIRNEQWVLNNDGPFIQKEEEGCKAYYIVNDRVEEYICSQYDSLVVRTGEKSMNFKVKLKTELLIESSFYNRPKKLIAFSDIEGNLDALIKLLQSNRIIDGNLNWIFGSGHLVFAGDMFDRGEQVTECLWLVYSLEEKAKAAGGYVHFILGNHEIMNLNNDLRYVQQKYLHNAKTLGKDYSKDLYGVNSKLGAWLRTKNIIEKIGDILFTHAGISPEVNALNLTVGQINELARPYYDRESEARRSDDKRLSLLFDFRLSPFWYRLYYQKDSMRIAVASNSVDTSYRTSELAINSILNSYSANHIVTGHTIFKYPNGVDGERVTVHFGNKIINTDTKHAKGYSEALLIEGNKYYRVNDKGERWLLFEDKKNE